MGCDYLVCGTRSQRRRCECGARCTKLCDFPITPKSGKSRTCDKPLCSKCRRDWTAELGRPGEPPDGDTLDLCRAHAEHLARTVGKTGEQLRLKGS